MTKPRHSLDGFVPRRPGSQLGEHLPGTTPQAGGPRLSLSSQQQRPDQLPTTLRRTDAATIRSEIDESLRSIDSEDPGAKGRGRKSRRGAKAPKSKFRRVAKWTSLLLLVVLIGAGGWLLYKALHAGGNIFKGNILDIVQNQPLKQDENGRSNILILGTSEDDPGHQGASLTDSIMILSVDQKNKNAYMISIPRDLEVKYGMACNAGYQGKINEYFGCVGGDPTNIEATRTALMKEAGFIGGIVGLDIQYGVNVNYTVMRELVKAVGDITVTIESRDPHGQMDSNFDWKCGVTGVRLYRTAKEKATCPPNGHFIDYPNGPATLDAEHALYLAQARGDSEPTYGFEQSNFDREKNQQKIVKAIREKAVSAGTLSDIGKVTGIIDALGTNLRTTFETKEIRTLVDLAKDIKSENIQSISLVDAEPPLLTGNAQPTEGLYQFSAIQAYIKKKLSSNPVVREEAKIAVLNGSGVPGVAQQQANKLSDQGFTITTVDTAPEGTYGNVEVYQVGTDKSATKAKLEALFTVKVKTTAPPVSVAEGTNFVIIFGKDPDAAAG